MQVLAFSKPGDPTWRWRIVNYAGEQVEESHETFATIAAAVAQGATRLAEMDSDDRSNTASNHRPPYRPRGR